MFNKNRVAMRIGDWKYVRPHKKLFNLKTNPGEKKNLPQNNEDIIWKIKARLDTYTKSLSRTCYPQPTAKGHAQHWNGTWTYGWC